MEVVETFRDEVRKGFRGMVKGPFNEAERERAGLTKDFYIDLRGELDDEVIVQQLEEGIRSVVIEVGG